MMYTYQEVEYSDGLYQSLQAKVHDNLKLVQDPVYSNALGLYKLGTMIS